jgi:Tfp pilus assembly protein PilX
MRGNIARRGMAGKVSFPEARPSHGNRGVILLIVLGMLQLLALIGIAFTTYASHGGPADAIERVQQDVRLAQTALTALLERPEDPSLQELALVNVDQALQASSDLIDGLGKPPTPETGRLQGLLRAAESLFNQLVAVLRDPPSR